MSDSVAEFPHHTDMLAYLEAFARENDLERFITCGAWVDAVRPVEAGWDVTVRGTGPRRFDVVVVASGDDVTVVERGDHATLEVPPNLDSTRRSARLVLNDARCELWGRTSKARSNNRLGIT